MNLFKRIRLLQTVRNGIIQSAAVVAPPGLNLCNPYFLISETNGRNASINNFLIRVFNVKREILTLFSLILSYESMKVVYYPFVIQNHPYTQLSFYSTTINTFLHFLTGYKLLSIRDMTTVFPSRYMSVLLLGIKIDT